jgi:Xaa-Pro dipeptidase
MQPERLREITPDRRAERRTRAAGQLRKSELDFLFLCPGKDFEYLTGLPGEPSERLLALMIDAGGQVATVCPSFEVTRMLAAGLSNIHAWEEHEDPYKVAACVMSPAGGSNAGRIALDGRTRFETYLRLRGHLPDAEFLDGGPIVAGLRMKKEPEEILLMRRACEITAKMLEEITSGPLVGKTEKEIGAEIGEIYRRHGTEGGALVQSGPNTAIPHGGPSDRKISECDVLLIDTGCSIYGYCSDVTRTYVVGEMSGQFENVYEIVARAQGAGIGTASPGTPCEDVDYAARKVIEDEGMGRFFTHRLGHGIGLEGHEHPYLVRGNDLRLEKSMTMTIEPGIYMEEHFGVRIEDVIAISDSGREVLSDMIPKDLRVLPV